MKTCLLCDNTETDSLKFNADYLCRSCLKGLIKKTPEQISEQYLKYVEEGNRRAASALFSFVPKRIRDANPLPRPNEPIRT